MRSRHNDILQDDDEFTSLAATSPNDYNYQFYYHQPGSPGLRRAVYAGQRQPVQQPARRGGD